MGLLIVEKLTEKPMGRPPVKNRYVEQRRHLAALIDAALKSGQRGDGTQMRFWQPWTEPDFANRVGTGASSASDWRDPVNPTRPVNIIPILKVLFGDIPAYADAKKEMLLAWRCAGGIEDDDPPEARRIDATTFSEVAEVVTLMLNQPTPLNDGTLRVPYTLRFFYHLERDMRIFVDGKPVDVVMDIGLTQPLFVVDSRHWQPVEDSIFRQREHPNVRQGPARDSVTILKPTGQGHDCIEGEPLKSEAHLIMEKMRDDEDGPITMAVKVPPNGIKISLRDGRATSLTQQDVLDAIFASAMPRDTHKRITVESVTIGSNRVHQSE